MKRHILSLLASLCLLTAAPFFTACSGSDPDPASGGQGGGGGQAGNGGAGGQGGGSALLCNDRTGGALVTFDIVDFSFTVWITNGAFIDEAKMLLANGMQRVPVFEQVVDGQDCDPDWSYHVDPEKVSFADVTIELCDGTPQYIEENKADWMMQVKSYCPWSAKVVAVDDRR